MKYPYAKHRLSHQDIILSVKALKSGIVSRGKFTRELEERLCEETGAKFCVAVSSGTAALHCTYLAIADEFSKKNDAIGMNKNSNPLQRIFNHSTKLISSPITFVSALTTGVLSGFSPEFCDVLSDEPQIDTKLVQHRLEELKAKGEQSIIVPTAMTGQSYNQQELYRIAKSFDSPIIADHSHSLGAYISDENDLLPMANTRYADVITLSFQTTKVITGGGEGGAILTDSEEVYKKLVAIRSHGMVYENLQRENMGIHYHEMQLPGLNYRITEMQAALCVSQLNRLGEIIEQRNVVASWYYELLQDTEKIELPKISDSIPAWHLFAVRLKERNRVATELRKKGIGTQVHYLPVYKHPWFGQHGMIPKENCSNAEAYYESALSLPMYPHLRKKDVRFIAETLKNILK